MGRTFQHRCSPQLQSGSRGESEWADHAGGENAPDALSLSLLCMMEGKKAESKCIAPPPFLQPSHHRGLLIQGLSRIRRVGGDAPHLFLRSVCCCRNIPRAESLIAIVFAIKDSHGSFMHGLDSGRTGLTTRPRESPPPSASGGLS